ncbi:protein phosphatase 1 regulatory subunit 14A isoform X2 [Xenopus laevis]|uniref:Protein phosphatase 1 regulatory subunit 14A isoform X2 n=1 Tax=Xenopus laevis TaxID=8355 RepID=A0A8J0TP37_XENLA|nr:protein phosphatase 1 regulatory subunit 14A isoform X2 [Xenopus laevis]
MMVTRLERCRLLRKEGGWGTRWRRCMEEREANVWALWMIKEVDMPDEVNIDDLLDLETDEDRRRSLQVTLKSCTNNTEVFIQELLLRLKGLQKQTLLKKNGLEFSSEGHIVEHA